MSKSHPRPDHSLHPDASAQPTPSTRKGAQSEDGPRSTLYFGDMIDRPFIRAALFEKVEPILKMGRRWQRIAIQGVGSDEANEEFNRFGRTMESNREALCWSNVDESKPWRDLSEDEPILAITTRDLGHALDHLWRLKRRFSAEYREPGPKGYVFSDKKTPLLDEFEKVMDEIERNSSTLGRVLDHPHQQGWIVGTRRQFNVAFGVTPNNPDHLERLHAKGIIVLDKREVV